VLRIHADADPDLAAELLLQAVGTLLNEGVLVRANAGPDGFLAHAVDGLEARVALRATPPTADLRARIVATLQRIAAETSLTDPAQRAQRILTDLGEPITAPSQSAPALVSTTSSIDDTEKRRKVIIVAAGVGAAIAAIAIGVLVTGLATRRRMPTPSLTYRRRRDRS
jgi:hypothetical protein